MQVFEPKSYLKKKLMKRWMEKSYPKIRLGTLRMIDPRHVTSFVYLADKNISTSTTTGIALEIPYKRG